MANVLIIDDDKGVCGLLSEMIGNIGHHATSVHTLESGLHESSQKTYDVVFLDVGLPDGNGLEAIPRLLGTQPPPEVVIITGSGEPDGAEIAIRNGAWDYLQKPLSVVKILLPIKRVLQYRDDLSKHRKPAVALKVHGIVGGSQQMKACLDLVAQAADSETNVLISGETGTGKELIAHAIHGNSSRAPSSFVVVDCASLPETLVESSLFGYEKGAFTGADRARDGLIKQADGGTLFLDEVGELPLSIQKAFLRVLQERSFRPLGAKQEIRSDFRLIAATNRDLDQMVECGLFRKDLLYRLKTMSIVLSPLRDRPGDVKDLVMYYTARLCEFHGIATKGFSPEFFEVLAAYDWPGNVRELVNTIEICLSGARYAPTFFPKHLPTQIRVKVARGVMNEKATV
ncbi:MAG TPA: Fis family transcriptional regulator, partial [Syntrophobacteraceae bacterium]|nr:Fis family transcriptional regulator [Syntrophobacteraceae bacterium]